MDQIHDTLNEPTTEECDDTDVTRNHVSGKRLACLTILYIITVIIGFFSIGNDMQSVLRWELACLALTLSVLPLTAGLFQRYKSRGYIYGRVIGLAIAGYLQWLLSSLGILSFGTSGVIISCLITAVCVYGVWYIYSRKSEHKTYGVGFLEIVLSSELILLILFVAFVWLLGHRIPSTETERAMDYAFMVTLDKTKLMPPQDVWASGEYINYYYFGLYLMTYLSKLSFVPVAEGYSLGLAMIGSLCLAYSYNAVSMLLGEKGLAARLGGVISAIAVTCCGNMHYIVFYRLAPMLWDILRIDGEKPTYWFASSTRYIGYIPDDPADRTISEFPWYSFLIGDLHAHVIDIIIVLTMIALLIAYAVGNAGSEALKKETERSPYKLLNSVFMPHIIMVAFFTGIAAMTNYWDFPIYYVVAGSIILFANIYSEQKKGAVVFKTACQGLFILLVAELVKLPFELKFGKPVNGIRICEQHSLIHQLVILWGLPLFILILFICFLRRHNKGRAEIRDVVALLLGLCGLGLALMPEFIFVEDIYVEGFPRCNTMFKLTYQAFILCGLMMGYVLARILTACRAIVRDVSEKPDISRYVSAIRLRRAAIAAAFLLIMTAGYAVTSCRQWYGTFKEWNYKGIDATTGMRQDMGEEAKVLEWIEDNTEGREVILTADAPSYTSGALISALSGHPTVLGWNTHEWLWHNSRDYIMDRQKDVTTVYTSDDIGEIKALIDRYDIEYIYVGPGEYEKYGFVDTDRLTALGRIVYRDNDISAVIIKTGEE